MSSDAEGPVRPTQASAQDVDPVTSGIRIGCSGWAIQIGSLPSERQARDMLAKASATAGRTLRSASPYTETFNEG
ncbi:hypothetical protein VXQ18_03940 [Brucella abortus]|nr:hypothetical protein [Brucella abortus]